MIREGERAPGRRTWRQYRTIDYGDKHLTVRAIKVSIDGALGSRGAWLLEPYTDLPASTGLNTDAGGRSARDGASSRSQHDYQLCVHAIGDRANRETLNIYEETFKANPDTKDLRWRIEHAQHLNPADIPRFGAAGRRSRRCRASTARRTRRTCSRASARSAPRKAPTSGRS